MSSLKKSLKDAKRDLNSVNDTVSTLQNSVNKLGKGDDKGLRELQKKWGNVAQDIKKSIEDIYNQKSYSSNKVFTFISQDEKKNLEDAKAALEDLRNQEAKAVADLGANKDDPLKVTEILENIAKIRTDIKDTEDDIKRFNILLSGKDIGEFRTTKEIEEQKEKLIELQKQYGELKGSLADTFKKGDANGNPELQTKLKLLSDLEGEIRLVQSALQTAYKTMNVDAAIMGDGSVQPIISKYQALKTTISTSMAAISTAVKNTFSHIGEYISQTKIGSKLTGAFSSVQKFFNGFKGLGADIGAAASKIGALVKGMGKVVAFSVKATLTIGKFLNKLNPIPKIAGKLSKAFHTLGSKIKTAFIYSAINSWFNSIKTQVSTYLTLDSNLQAALRTNKGAWLTAFQPIYETVIPALTKLLNLLTQVGYKFAQFTSLLTGKSVAASQASAKALYDQAKATDEAGAAAERTIAPFDELNKLNGSSGGGSSSTEDTVEFGEIPEMEVYSTWSEAFGALLDRLIAKLPAFNELMSKAAEKINAFSKNLLEMFTADGIQEKVTTLATGIADAFNTLLHGVDWNQLGKSIGAGIQTAINFVLNFIKTIDWFGIGKAAADGLNGTFSQINWYQLGDLIIQGWNIIWQTVNGFISTFDYSTFGKQIADGFRGMIENLDLASVGSAISNFVKGVFDFVRNFIQNTDWKQLMTTIVQKLKDLLLNIDYKGIIVGAVNLVLAAIKAAFQVLIGLIKNLPEILKIGWEIVKGVLAGIVEGIKNIVVWLKENLVDPIVNGVKKLFGIHSPSTVFKEIGSNLIEGLLAGLKNSWSKLKNWFSDTLTNIKTWCRETWDSVKSNTKETWDAIKTNLATTCQNIKEDIQTKWTNIKTHLTDATENIKEKVSEKWDTMKSNLSTATETLRSNVCQKWNDMKSALDTSTSTLKSSLENKWANLKSALETKTASLKSNISSYWTNMKSSVESLTDTMKSNLGSKFDSMKSSLSSKASSVKSGIVSAFSGMKESLESTFNGMKTSLCDIFETMKTSIGTKLSSLSTNVSSVISNIGTKLSNLWDKLSTAVTTSASIKVPAMANGGIVKSPTLAMIGEYSGASSNPEIVTPESLLTQIVNNGNDELIDVMIQLGRQTIAAINGVDMTVKIGDDTIASSVKRSNQAALRQTGKPLFSY